MTFAEALELINKDKCVTRSWWQQDYGKQIIGLRRGDLMRFQFDKWNRYTLTQTDMQATDWEVIPDAPSLDEVLLKVDELKERLVEKEEYGGQKITEELRRMIGQRLAEDKRNKS